MRISCLFFFFIIYLFYSPCLYSRSVTGFCSSLRRQEIGFTPTRCALAKYSKYFEVISIYGFFAACTRLCGEYNIELLGKRMSSLFTNDGQSILRCYLNTAKKYIRFSYVNNIIYIYSIAPLRIHIWLMEIFVVVDLFD